MDYFFEFLIIVCIVAFVKFFIESNNEDNRLPQLVTIIMFIGIIGIAIKYLFTYIGISILWLMGLLILTILICICSAVQLISILLADWLNSLGRHDDFRDCFCSLVALFLTGFFLIFSIITLFYVIFIVGLHEVFIYTFRNEDVKVKTMSINYNFF
jgi:hypothetical protein